MPESPCRDCGKPALHTDDDPYPRCENCAAIRQAVELILDISYGRLEVPKTLVDEEGNDVE